MGFKKKMLYSAYDMAKSNPRSLKKMAIFAGVSFLFLIVLAAILITVAISGFKGLAASTPDLDMLALQELAASGALALTEAQKAELRPIVKKISEGTITPDERTDLKKQLFGLLAPSQVGQVEDWKAATVKKAGEFTSAPQSIIAAAERYTGIPIKHWIDALLSWWKITKPEDSAGELIDILNDKK